MENHWQEVRTRICHKCMDGDSHGNCRLPVGETCALESFFPELVDTISKVHSTSYDDYVKALRLNICRTCAHQLSDGECFKRNALECALDRYYPLLIEIVEELTTEFGKRTEQHS